MRTTVTMDDDLLAAAKRRAADHGVSLSALVQDAVRAALSTPAPFDEQPFELITFCGRGPRAGVDLDRTSELLEADAERAFGSG